MWHKCFKDGQEYVESDPCSGRPSASRAPENAERVRAAISKDCWLTVRELEADLRIPKTTAFPKTKITYERDCWWDSGKYNGAADGDSNKGFCRVFCTVEEMLGELCEVPRYLLWRGLRSHCPVYNVSCILFNTCLYFHSTWLDTFWTDLFVCV